MEERRLEGFIEEAPVESPHKVKIILDPGSTHMGKYDYALQLVDAAIGIGADAIKFQMFPNTREFTSTGNIPFNPDWYGNLIKHVKMLKKTLEITASVFDYDSLEFLNKWRPPFIKFAYSQQHRLNWIEGLLAIGVNVIVSTDVMNAHKIPKHKNLRTLFCQPIYPTIWRTNFSGLFPDRFHGFSDHSLGINESINAVKSGAKIIEKHFMLPYEECKTCPDGKFAISIDEARQMVEKIRAWEKSQL